MSLSLYSAVSSSREARDLSQKLDQAVESFEETSAKLEKKSANLEEVTKELVATQKGKANAESKLAKSQKKVDDDKKKIAALSKDKDDIKKDRDSLQRSLSNKQAAYDELKKKIDERKRLQQSSQKQQANLATARNRNPSPSVARSVSVQKKSNGSSNNNYTIPQQSNSSGWRKITVQATGYVATGNPTATGTTPTAGRTIAVDPSVIPLGSKVRIPAFGNGIYTAEDTGGKVHGHIIDIFMSSQSQAVNWGRRTIEVYVQN